MRDALQALDRKLPLETLGVATALNRRLALGWVSAHHSSARSVMRSQASVSSSTTVSRPSPHSAPALTSTARCYVSIRVTAKQRDGGGITQTVTRAFGLK